MPGHCRCHCRCLCLWPLPLLLPLPRALANPLAVLVRPSSSLTRSPGCSFSPLVGGPSPARVRLYAVAPARATSRSFPSFSFSLFRQLSGPYTRIPQFRPARAIYHSIPLNGDHRRGSCAEFHGERTNDNLANRSRGQGGHFSSAAIAGHAGNASRITRGKFAGVHLPASTVSFSLSLATSSPGTHRRLIFDIVSRSCRIRPQPCDTPTRLRYSAGDTFGRLSIASFISFSARHAECVYLLEKKKKKKK